MASIAPPFLILSSLGFRKEKEKKKIGGYQSSTPGRFIFKTLDVFNSCWGASEAHDVHATPQSGSSFKHVFQGNDLQPFSINNVMRGEREREKYHWARSSPQQMNYVSILVQSETRRLCSSWLFETNEKNKSLIKSQLSEPCKSFPLKLLLLHFFGGAQENVNDDSHCEIHQQYNGERITKRPSREGR